MYTNKFFDFLPLSFRNVKRVHIFLFISHCSTFPSRSFFELSLLCLLAMKSEDFQLILPLLYVRYQRANEFTHKKMRENFMLLLSLKEALRIVLREWRRKFVLLFKEGGMKVEKLLFFAEKKKSLFKSLPIYFLFSTFNTCAYFHSQMHVAAIEFLVCIFNNLIFFETPARVKEAIQISTKR